MTRGSESWTGRNWCAAGPVISHEWVPAPFALNEEMQVNLVRLYCTIACRDKRMCEHKADPLVAVD